MRFLWISALKDLRRLRREPTTLLTWLAIPTFIAVILTAVFGRGDPRPHGTLLIADEDRGMASSVLLRSFTQPPLSEMLTVEKVDREEGRRRMDHGQASALLIIPAGFSSSFIAPAPVKIQLIRSPSQRILPGMIEETLSTIVDGAFYVQSIGVGRGSVDQRLIQLDTKVIPDKSESKGGFAVLLLPGVIYMAIFFITRALSVDFWLERNSGALRRVLTTPSSLTAFLLGKLLAGAIVLAVAGAFALLAGNLLLNLNISHFPIAVLWIVATGAGMYLLMLLLQTAATSERMANLLTSFVMLPLTMLGGGFVPLDWMPPNLANLGRMTPNGWSVIHLQSMLNGTSALVEFGFVILFLLAVWPVVQWRIRNTAC